MSVFLNYFVDYREQLYTEDPRIRWTDRVYPDGTWEANLFQFYVRVYNNALHSAYNETSFEEARTNPRLWGRWVESAVGAYLLNHSDEKGYKVQYWRETPDEVDFVLTRNRISVAVEVKSGRRKAGRGISVFANRYKPKRNLNVGTGGIPVEEFLLTDIDKIF